MVDVQEFVNLASKITARSSAEEHEQLSATFQTIPIDQDTAGLACNGLGAIPWTRAVVLLADKWTQIAIECRHVFLRWAFNEGETRQLLGKTLALAGLLADRDVETSLRSLQEAYDKTRGSPAVVEQQDHTIRTFWLKPRGTPSLYPFERWSGESMKPAVRIWAATILCTTAGARRSVGGKTAKPDLLGRRAIESWLDAPPSLPIEQVTAFRALLGLIVTPARSESPDPSDDAGHAEVATVANTPFSGEANSEAPVGPQPDDAAMGAPATDLPEAADSPSDKSRPDQPSQPGAVRGRLTAALRRWVHEGDHLLRALEDQEQRWHHEVAQAGAKVEELESQRNHLLDELSLLRKELTTTKAELDASRQTRDVALATSEKLTAELATAQQVAIALEQKVEQERDAARLHLDAVVQDAVRARSEEIGNLIAHLVEAYRHWQSHQEAPDPATHLAGLIDSILNLLASKDVPIRR